MELKTSAQYDGMTLKPLTRHEFLFKFIFEDFTMVRIVEAEFVSLEDSRAAVENANGGPSVSTVENGKPDLFRNNKKKIGTRVR